jgi:hypothetical protein
MDDTERAIALIKTHPVMDQAEVSRTDQKSVVALLKTSQLFGPAREVEEMALAEFEDFLVNNCGED